LDEASRFRKHVKWAKKLPEYAAIFRQTDRTIKRWIRRGKETGELPPLDNPSRMAAWWRRNMDHEVPDYLLGFIDNRHSGAGADPHAKNSDAGSGAAVTGNSGEAGSQSQSRDLSQVKSLDIVENVEALRHTHAINKHLLDEALHAEEPNDTITTLRRKNFEGSFELLRKAEVTLIEIQKQRGDLIDKEKVRSELAQILESLRLMRETMPHRIIIALEQILPRRIQRVGQAFLKYLEPAIEKARADEEKIFRNLEALDGPEAVQKLLAA
jgi:hypothetical protein